jgi:4-amino-4-deoxy-L-arabinose transferase-like glycosyltransferase
VTGVFALFSILLAGYFVRGMLPGPTPPGATPIEELPTYFGIGAGALFLFFLTGSLMGPVSLHSLHLFIALVGMLWLFLRNRTDMEKVPGEIPPRLEKRECLFLAVLTIFLLFLFGIGFLLPIFDWEARILWALKAKILTAEPTVTGRAFLDPYLLHIHPRYPLMVPFLSSWMARNQGAFLEWHYQLLIDTFALLTVWQVYVLLRRLTHRRIAQALTSVMALTGIWTASLFGSRVEIALAFFLVLGVHQLFLWLERRRTFDMILGGAFLFCGAMTKNEGILLALCACFAIFLVVIKEVGIRAAIRATALLAGAFILLSAVWFVHLLKIPPVSDEQYLNRFTWDIFTRGMGRLPEIALAVMARVTDLSNWHLLWLTPLVPALALYRGHRVDDRRLRMASILAISYIAGLLTIFMVSPWRDIGLQITVTFDRVALPLLPVFIVMIALASAND